MNKFFQIFIIGFLVTIYTKEAVFLNNETVVIIAFLTFVYALFSQTSTMIATSLDTTSTEIEEGLTRLLKLQEEVLLQNKKHATQIEQAYLVYKTITSLLLSSLENVYEQQVVDYKIISKNILLKNVFEDIVSSYALKGLQGDFILKSALKRRIQKQRRNRK